MNCEIFNPGQGKPGEEVIGSAKEVLWPTFEFATTKDWRVLPTCLCSGSLLAPV